MDLSVSSSSWGLGRAAFCDCATPWTFLLPFFGVWWQTDQDVFTFKESAPGNMFYTKWNFLKKIATLFDPVGFLAPYTIRAKMLLQNMWTAGIEWNDEFTEWLVNSACASFDELCELRNIHVPRCLWTDVMITDTMSLQTFVDASESTF